MINRAAQLSMELHDRLVKWSYWIIAIKNNQIGYPAKSTIADFGMPSSYVRQSKPPMPLNNQEADEMNGWVNHMGAFYPQYKQVITAFYLRTKETPIWVLAQHFGISPDTFKKILGLSRSWISSKLSKEYEK
jgi:hypothetical protein